LIFRNIELKSGVFHPLCRNGDAVLMYSSASLIRFLEFTKVKTIQQLKALFMQMNP